MYIYFSGIGGSGISALAHFCLDLGWQVAGSDLQSSLNTDNLKQRGAKIFFNQNGHDFTNFLSENTLDLFVYSSSINQKNAELKIAKAQNIKTCKRDGLINFIITETGLELVAICGTHGKTTTTSMFSWLFEKLEIPYSHLIGTNLNWANSGKFTPESKILFLEADEYDRNFLQYSPKFSLLTSIDYDHPDTYPTQDQYLQAFAQFFSQSDLVCGFTQDLAKTNLVLQNTQTTKLLDKDRLPFSLDLSGLHNRQNANLALTLAQVILSRLGYGFEKEKLIKILNSFPGTERRQEKLAQGVYSDYAHHPKEIKATLQAFSEYNNKIALIYQPHQNLRQHQIKNLYVGSFSLAQKVFWLPTFLTRENPDLEILTPKTLTSYSGHLDTVISEMDLNLEDELKNLYEQGYTLLFCGAGDIDTWARNFVTKL